MQDLAQSGSTDVKTVIVGSSAVRMAHGAGWLTSVDMAIGSLADRTRIVRRIRSGTLVVVFAMVVVAVAAAEL